MYISLNFKICLGYFTNLQYIQKTSLMVYGPHVEWLFVICTQFCSACVQNHFCCYCLNRNKTDVLKGDQSALNQKVLHSPLPLPPLVNSQPPTASDNNSPVSRKKLDPIAVENEEANSSEKKKKKKKKKKKRTVDEAGDNENEN